MASMSEQTETRAAQHTPEPWRVEDRRHAPLKNIRILAGLHEIGEVSDVHQRDQRCGGFEPRTGTIGADAVDALGIANAARIVACVNALAGLNPEAVRGLIEATEKASVKMSELVSDACDCDRVHVCGLRELDRLRAALQALKVQP